MAGNRRRRTIGTVLVFVVPFLALFAVAHFLLPRARDWTARRPLGSAGRDLVRDEVGSVVLYAFPSADPAAMRGMAERLEGFCRSLVATWGEFFHLRTVPPPITLQVFAGRDDLVTVHAGRFHEDFANLGGFYDPGERLVALAWTGDPEGFEEALFHEATHLVFDVSRVGLAPLSPWLSEGLATYFAVSRVGPAGSGRIGGADPRLFAIAARAEREGTLPALRDLLEAGADRFAGEGNRVLYAAAHVTVAFLLDADGGKYREAFRRTYAAWRRIGSADPRLLYWNLLEDAATVEASWRRFLTSPPVGR